MWEKSSLAGVFEFCWSSFADEHYTLPKSTRRNLTLNKFAFRNPWLLDLLCKHWFTSSVCNFCHWVADDPTCKRSSAAKSEEKQPFSQPNNLGENALIFYQTIQTNSLTKCTEKFIGGYWGILKSFKQLVLRALRDSKLLTCSLCFCVF